jgi:hypothetical protein
MKTLCNAFAGECDGDNLPFAFISNPPLWVPSLSFTFEFEYAGMHLVHLNSWSQGNFTQCPGKISFGHHLPLFDYTINIFSKIQKVSKSILKMFPWELSLNFPFQLFLVTN